MSVKEKINAKREAILKEKQQFPNGPFQIADEVQEKAMKAMVGGQTSPDWEVYMKLFTSDTKELDRMIPKDNHKEHNRQQARAYLVRNGMCGIGTTWHLADNVTDVLDY